MGFFGWVYDNFLMSAEEKRRKANVEAYSREMKAHWAEYRPQLQQARERWANTQKEMYRKGGTTALGLTVDVYEEDEEDKDNEADANKFEAETEKAWDDAKDLQKEIEIYKKDKMEAMQKFKIIE